MWKYSWRGLIWMVAHVFHRYHHFFARVSMVLWVLLILEFKMVSYIVLLIGITIHRSPVSLVLVVLRGWFMYLWRISKPRRTTVYMYKNQDNRKSHEKYQPWESGKPGITENRRAKETKRTWEPQVPETRRSKRTTRMLVKVNMSIIITCLY